jgi:hypothetical protein
LKLNNRKKLRQVFRQNSMILPDPNIPKILLTECSIGIVLLVNVRVIIMTELARKQFYNKIKDAPLAAQGFFEAVVELFQKDVLRYVERTNKIMSQKV